MTKTNSSDYRELHTCICAVLDNYCIPTKAFESSLTKKSESNAKKAKIIFFDMTEIDSKKKIILILMKNESGNVIIAVISLFMNSVDEIWIMDSIDLCFTCAPCFENLDMKIYTNVVVWGMIMWYLADFEHLFPLCFEPKDFTYLKTIRYYANNCLSGKFFMSEDGIFECSGLRIDFREIIKHIK